MTCGAPTERPQARRNSGAIWSISGTPAGTLPLNGAAVSPKNFTAVGDQVYFFSFGNLWKTDGTPAGTTPVRAVGLSNNGQYMINVAGTLFYSDGNALWRSDGTFAG